MTVLMQPIPVTTQSLSILSVLGIVVYSDIIGDDQDSPAINLINDSLLSGLTSLSTKYHTAEEMTPDAVERLPTATPIHFQVEPIREPNQTTNSKLMEDTKANHQQKPEPLLRVVCSFDSTSPSRANKNRFLILNMSVSLCTDLYYDHAMITEGTNEIQAISKLDIFPLDGNMYIPSFVAINDFKVKFPGLRTFLTIVESPKISFAHFTHGSKKLKSFVKSCLKQARIWGFDGINIEWRRLPNLGAISHILHHLKITFEKEVTLNRLPKLLLGVSFFGDIRQFKDLQEVALINGLVDQVNLLPFNLVDEKATETHLKSPLYPIRQSETKGQSMTASKNKAFKEIVELNITEELTKRPKMIRMDDSNDNMTIHDNSTTLEMATESFSEISTESTFNDKMTDDRDFISTRTTRETDRPDVSLKEALDALVTNGVSKSKINVAISLTGQSYTLKDPAVHGIGAPVVGLGSFHDKAGQVYFRDMCKVNTGTTMMASDEDDTPYWYNESLWISYENIRSIRQKIDYIIVNNIGGIMLMSQSEDDFTGENCNLGPFVISKMVYNMSYLNFQQNRQYYSFPWTEFCGLGTAPVGELLLLAQCVVVSVSMFVSL